MPTVVREPLQPTGTAPPAARPEEQCSLALAAPWRACAGPTRAPPGDAERGCGSRAAGSVPGSRDSSAPEGGEQVCVQGPHADLGPSAAAAVSSQKSALRLEFILRRARGSTGAHRERSCHGPTRTRRQESGKSPRDTSLLPALPRSEATLTQCLRHLATSSPSVWPMRPFGAGGVGEDTALQVLATGRLR